ncbi:MAG TPA: hypothetical protein VN761_11030 [Candidatus Polarisedimenticolia bacterium]|nr:hypothetical protein [Candidatus Polarisedimenticolia bacterium]
MNSPLFENPEMYFAVIEGSPQSGTEAFEKYDIAHIACWINVTDLKSGRERAKALVERYGWFARALKEEKIISAAGYDPKNDGLKKFNQALIDDEVCVVYALPRRPN